MMQCAGGAGVHPLQTPQDFGDPLLALGCGFRLTRVSSYKVMRARLLLLAAALVAFGASLGSGFHFDDYAIFSDPALQSSRGWLEIWSLRQTRPLTFLSFWLNGHNPLAMHLVNLLLHLAAVLLVFECLRRLLPERAALLAAAIFAAHPLQ